MFASSNQEELIKECRRLAIEKIGYTIPMAKELISLYEFLKTRRGLCSCDEELTSYSEFKVSKITRRAELPVQRLLYSIETCIIERDLATYAVMMRKHRQIEDLQDSENGAQEHKNTRIENFMYTEKTYSSRNSESKIADSLGIIRRLQSATVHGKQRNVATKGRRVQRTTF
ncbi:unnamed protein product [Caenorhabditis nigoni]